MRRPISKITTVTSAIVVVVASGFMVGEAAAHHGPVWIAASLSAGPAMGAVCGGLGARAWVHHADENVERQHVWFFEARAFLRNGWQVSRTCFIGSHPIHWFDAALDLVMPMVIRNIPSPPKQSSEGRAKVA